PAPTQIYTLSLHDALPILKAYNKTVLKKPFYYKIAPQYGTKSKSLTGSITLNYNQYIQNTSDLFSINYGISASYASYAEDLFVRDRKSTRLNSSHVKISYA